MVGRLAGQVALVSGSTQGFGKGILETFVREGATVLGMDLQATDGPVTGLSEEQAYQIKANVAEEASWKKAVSRILGAGQHRLHISPRLDQHTLLTNFRHISLIRPLHGSVEPRLSSFIMPAGRTQTSLVSR
jgi:NAD(P)-dependent dehydrogenase (short-subunit alcohol dehydrogenase family)